MKITRSVKKILDNSESDCPGSKTNLARILMHGRLGGLRKMVILPVDQGFEHGPGRSFAPNPDAYDPHYHYQLAIDAGLNAPATFNGRRIVVFSGGEAKDLEGLFAEIRGLRDGGTNGSIIGRNTFQRPRDQALDMLDKIIVIYQGKM